MNKPMEFNVVEVRCTSDGRCTVCGENFAEGAAMCHMGHPLGELYHQPKYGSQVPPFRLVRAAMIAGSRCALCGGQVDSGNVCSTLQHQMGTLYPMDKKNAPSLFP